MSMLSCSVVLPTVEAWKIAFSVHLGLIVFVLTPISILLYPLPHRVQKPTAFLLGLATGAAPPLSVGFSPFVQESRWMSLFLWASFGFSCFFRCMTVALGSFPEGADNNLATWIFWFASLPEPIFAKGKLVHIPIGELQRHVRLHLAKFIGLAALLSVFLVDINPFQTGKLMNQNVAFLVDAWMHLWWIFLWASFLFDFGALLVKASGYTTEPSFSNPLLQSRSYKEFWGIRWNRPVHLFLKRTIYAPARQYLHVPPFPAAFLAFCASGLMHEYNFFTHNHSAYRPGFAIMFFLFVGTFMVLEMVVVATLVKDRSLRHVPSFAITIVLTAPTLPAFERLFFRSWIESGMLNSARELLPHLDCS